MIESYVRELVGELENTKEFRELKSAKKSVDNNPTLKNRVDQFLQDNAEAFQEGCERSSRKEEEMKARFEMMMKVPEIKAYFDAAHRFEYVLFKLHEQIDRMTEEKLEGQ